MPEGFRIASAWVEVKPDTEGFKERLQAALDEATAGTDARAHISLDTAGFDARLDAARARLDEFGGSRAEPSLHLNDEGLASRVDEARARLDELDARTARPDVGLGTADIDARIEEVHARLEEIDGEQATPRVGLDTGEFQARVAETRAELAALGEETASPRVFRRDARGRFAAGGGSGPAQEAVQAAEDAAAVGGQLRDARGRFVRRGEEEAAAPLAPASGGSRGGFLSRLLGRAGGWLRGGSTGSGELGGSFEMEMEAPDWLKKAFKFTALGTVLSPAIGGTVMGAGLLGGAGVLGLGGIAGAVSAAHQASLNIGMTPQQVAATKFANRVGAEQARTQVGSARMQAAQDAITSAASIEQAQMNLASVQRNAAQSQIQALESVKQAQQGVQEADYGLSEAQYNLNQAWEAAREQIRQLNDQLADSKLSVKSAQLAIQQAMYNQRLVDQNAYSTSIQRSQAALAVAQAQQQLKDAQDQLTASQYQANLVNKQGLDGNQQVIQAKQALTQAQYGQQNATFAYANSQRQLTLTELNNAQQVKEAQLQLRMAQEQAAYQRQQDARNTAIAERNLANTVKEQQLQWAATKSTENQAALQFQKDMSRLTPAARGVVEQVLGMRGAFTGLKTASQNAIAPGLSVFLTGASKLMPSLTSGLSRMGTVISSAFSAVGKQMQTPAGAKVFNGLIDNGIRLAKTVLPAVEGLAGALARVGAKKGAVDGVANLIAGLAGGLTNAVKAFAPFTGALTTIGTVLGKALGPVGSLLGTVLGSLLKALAPVLQALLPAVQTLASALGQGLSAALAGLGPMLVPVAQAIAAVVEAAAPLLPVIGQLIGKLAQALTPVLQAVVPIIRQLAGLLAKDLVDGLLQVVTNLLPIVPAAGKLITSLMPVVSLVLDLAGVLIGLAAKIIGPVSQALAWLVSHILDLASHWKTVVHWIEEAAVWLWHNVLDPMWHGIAAGADWLYQNAILPLWHGIDDAFHWIEGAATWLWHNVFDPLWQGIRTGVSDFIQGFKLTWDGLKSIFENPVKFIVDVVYNNGIVKLWDDVAGAFGAKSLELKPIQGFAKGGEVTGGTPGRDSVPAMLTPGERVLSVGQVAKLGGQSGIDAMVGSARPVYKGGVAHAAGGWSWNPLTDLAKIGSAAWHGLKGVVLGGLRSAATPVIAGLEKVAKATLGTTGVGGMLDRGVNVTGKDILDFLGGKDSAAKGGGGGSLPGGSSSAVGNLPANWQAIASFLAGHGFTKYAAAGVAGNIMAESGGNPEILEIGGGGGGGLIQWTPYPAGYITGNAQADLMTQLYAILKWGGGPGLVNRATSPSNAAEIYQDYYERPASLTASLPLRMASANAVYKAMGWGTGFDSGGWLMPSGMPVNGLGRPEAVLTPDESAAFVQIVRHLTGHGGTQALGDRHVTIQYIGTQHPTAEQMADIERRMGLALSGQ